MTAKIQRNSRFLRWGQSRDQRFKTYNGMPKILSRFTTGRLPVSNPVSNPNPGYGSAELTQLFV